MLLKKPKLAKKKSEVFGFDAYKEKSTQQNCQIMQENQRLLNKITNASATLEMKRSQTSKLLPLLTNGSGIQKNQEIVRIFNENMRMVNRLAQVKPEVIMVHKPTRPKTSLIGTKRLNRLKLKLKEQ